MIPIGPGAPGDGVFAVQRLLREKVAAAVPTDGVYEAATAAAVRAFQAPGTGPDRVGQRGHVAGARLALRAARFSPSGLCDYSSGNGAANWGTPR